MSMVLNSLHFRFQKLGGFPVFPQWQGPLTRDLFLSGSRAGAVTHSENRVHVGSAPPAKNAHKLKLKFWQTRIKGCAFGNQRTYQQSQHDLIRVFYIFTRPASEVENSNIILLLPYYLPRNYIGPNVDHGLLNFFILFLVRIAGAMCSNIDDCDEGRSSLFFKGNFL